MKKNDFMALGTCFARAFHSEVETIKIFDDYLAKRILSEQEYQYYADNFYRSSQYYFPQFKGNKIDATRLVINYRILGDILIRSKLCENLVLQEMTKGLKKYLNIGAGYDTFAYRYVNNDFSVFEIDMENVINDKKIRFERSNLTEGCNLVQYGRDVTESDWMKNVEDFVSSEPIVVAMLGFVYYLPHSYFVKIIEDLSNKLCAGSKIIFDIDCADRKITGCNFFSLEEVVSICRRNGFRILEIYNHIKVEERYLSEYNHCNPSFIMHASASIFNLVIEKRMICS